MFSYLIFLSAIIKDIFNFVLSQLTFLFHLKSNSFTTLTNSDHLPERFLHA